ncbi:MAG: zinc ribbon domain-containing protein [Ruminococcaceae bacterium]|nr:zinc ribbon domain-containing protein [Oscillospiraceae bacterium]
MAVIVCPECGEKISDTVKNCIHCGCKINLCPECGGISVGDANSCPTCGYVWKSENEDGKSKKTDVNLKETTDVYDRWRSENPIRVVYGTKAINTIAFAGSLIFIGLAFLKMFLDINNDNFILKFSGSLSGVKTLLIFSAVMAGLRVLLNKMRSHIAACDMSAWLRMNKINAESIVNSTLELKFSNMTIDSLEQYHIATELVLEGATYAENKKAISKDRILLLTNAAIEIISIIFVAMFAISNVEVYMTTAYLVGSSSYEISMLTDLWMIITAGVALFVGWFFDDYVKKQVGLKKDTWINTHMPDKARKYEKYIKNYTDYAIEKMLDSDRTV